MQQDFVCTLKPESPWVKNQDAKGGNESQSIFMKNFYNPRQDPHRCNYAHKRLVAFFGMVQMLKWLNYSAEVKKISLAPENFLLNRLILGEYLCDLNAGGKQMFHYFVYKDPVRQNSLPFHINIKLHTQILHVNKLSA